MIGIGIIGAGRAAQLHLQALQWVHDVPIRLVGIADPNKKQAVSARAQHGFAYTADHYERLLDDPAIDVIDICTPPSLHAEMIRNALSAGKHVICEKPLTGYFGREEDMPPVGRTVSKAAMYEHLCETAASLRDIVAQSSKRFMYAENFVYAPAITRACSLIERRKSKILFLKGEESVNGSSSPVAGQWSASGGGAMMRLGCHPLSAALWLKQREAAARGETIHVRSVFADMGCASGQLSPHERRFLQNSPQDVEDQGVLTLAFSDDTRAVLMATDTLLGGSKNFLELYCNDAAHICTLTMNDLLQTYLPDEEGLDGMQLSELMTSHAGWTRPQVADVLIRGYVHEMQDFMESVYLDRPALSGFELASDTVRVLYAAYLSSESGRRVDIQPGE